MNSRIVHISSGRGPLECMWVVAKLAQFLTKEAQKAGLSLLSLEEVPGPKSNTAVSAQLHLEGEKARLEAFLQQWSGSVMWKGESMFRKHYKRKNWFVEVQEYKQAKTLKLDEKDIVFEYGKSSGPGGQHANKSMTMVRAKHLPTGNSVSIQDARSQYQNKKIAMQKLLAKIQEQQDKLLEENVSKNWKQQIVIQRGSPDLVFSGSSFKRVK